MVMWDLNCAKCSKIDWKIVPQKSSCGIYDELIEAYSDDGRISENTAARMGYFSNAWGSCKKICPERIPNEQY